MAKSLTLSINVSLPEPAVETLTNSVPGIGKDTLTTIGGLATGLLLDLADGGMMLSPTIMRQIVKLDPGVKSPAAVVDLAEKVTHRRGDALVAEWVVDPVYEARLREQAEMSSIGIRQLVQNIMDQIISRGIFFRIVPEPHMLLFGPEDIAMFRDMLGRQEDELLTGTEIANYVRELNALPVEGN